MLRALDLARRMEAGELTPERVFEQCAEAIAARESEVGAFASLDLEAAQRMAQAPSYASLPLRGLPVGLKDIFDTADLPTAYGSPIYAGHRPAADAALAALIRRAGGIVLGKTVTTECAHLDPGRTRNPHNLAHTPGGSSSGSAAAIAAGFLAIATGSQTGGSVIRPASFCGVAGYKPSFGLLPTSGMKCVSWHLDTAGLFAAGIADVAFAAAAIADRDLRVDGRSPAAPRLALLRNPPWPAASDNMMAAVDATARAVAKAGASVTEIELPPIFGEAYAAHSVIQGYEAFRSLAFEYDRHRDRLGRQLRELLDGAAGIDAATYDSARRTARRARVSLIELMANHDAILSPSAPGAAPAGLLSTGSSTFNRLWTLMGTPCVSVPGLADPQGLPLGVQLIGKFGADRATLEAAAFVERALPAR